MDADEARPESRAIDPPKGDFRVTRLEKHETSCAKMIGLSPSQVLDLGIPASPGKGGSIPRGSPELDAIEARHPGGIAGFVEEVLARVGDEGFERGGEEWLVDIW